MLDWITPLQRGRFGRGIKPCSLAYQIGRNPSDVRDCLRAVVFHMQREIFKAVGMVFDELFIIEVFPDDDVQKAQGERLRRSRTKLQPQFGPLGKIGPAGIDNNKPGAISKLFQSETGYLTFFVGGQHITGPREDETGRVVEIGDGVKPTGVDARDLPRGMAYILRCDDIGGTEDIGEPDKNEMLEALGHPDPKADCPRSGALLDRKKILCSFSERFIPGNPPPFPLAASAHTLERIAKTIRVIEAIWRHLAFVTGVPLI